MKRSATSAVSFSGLAILGQLAHSVINLLKCLRDRREVMHLNEFDERMLKDIGLTRSDVGSALAEPIYHNPSLILVRCTDRDARSEIMIPAKRQIRPVVPTVIPGERCA